MKRHGSMNHIFRLVWSHASNGWVAVAETSRGRGKSSSRTLVAVALSLSAVGALAAPVGGQVVSGAGSISQSGTTTSITQSSQNLSLNWKSFNVASKETVNFVQPTASAIAVNRIFDTNGTQILGRINANGQVYLINPNGVLFGQGSVVNVGGLVASTLDLNDASLSGNLRSFSGSGTGAIVNQGTINAASGGYVALLGNQVSNQGVISAQLGTVALGAGSAATLTFSGSSLTSFQVEQSVLNSLAENGGLIRADGGAVIMTAGAKDSLLASAVNNTGVIEARTVDNHEGTITLLGGMAAGTVNVTGTLDASAQNGGNGGFIETSAAHVRVANAATITSVSATGKSGEWLLDPVDFTIAATGGDMTGTSLNGQLANNDVVIHSVSGASAGTGAINVNDAVTWSVNKLTLNAQGDINVNANLKASGTASLALNYGLGAVALNNTSNITTKNAAVTLPDGTANFTTTQGSDGALKNYTVISTVSALQAINGSLNTNYAIGSNITATAFTPIGNAAAPFTGTFDGLGHTISNLAISTGAMDTGLFGVISGATILNVGLVAASVTGNAGTGALVGSMYASSVNNSYATGSVTGDAGTGGLVGRIVGSGGSNISNSYATDVVHGNAGTGGLVGSIAGAAGGTPSNISYSYATGDVGNRVGGGGAGTGGLVGSLATNSGNISNSYATGNVTSTGAATGGLVGSTAASGKISYSCASGDVQGDGAGTGGLVGSSAASGDISYSYATGNVMSVGAGTGGLVGSNTSGAIFRSFASGNVNGGGAGTGGLAGSNTLGVISDSFAVGNVSGSGHSIAAPGAAPTVGASTGGLVGSNSGTIRDTYAAGNVEGFAAGVGGLVGDGVGGSITNSYAAGHVTGQTGATGVGGLLGFGTGTVVDTNSYRLAGNVTLNGGATAAPAQASTALTSANLAAFTTSASPSPAWDFNSIWTMPVAGSAYQYPVLQGMTKMLTLTVSSVTKQYDGLAYSGTAILAVSPSCCTNNAAFITASFLGLGQINAGVYTITPTAVLANAALASYFAIAPIKLTITQAPVTVGGSVANNKVYDGTTADTLSGGTLTGVIAADVANVNLNQIGVFADPNAANGIHVTAADTLTGSAAGNYSITQPVNALAANITAKALTIGGTSVANNKAYDGTTAATLSGGALTGVIAADVANVNLNQIGIFADPNAANGIHVTAADTLTGSAAGNYSITQPVNALAANITAKSLTIGGTTAANNKTYDGTTAATLSGGALTGVIAADVANVNLNQIGIFADPNAANGIHVTAADTLTGSAAGNYSITQPVNTLAANITAKSLTIGGTSVANNKTYDGTTAATLSGGALTGVIAADVGNVNLNQIGVFANPNAAKGIHVTAADTLTGSAAGNYSIIQPTNPLTADITSAAGAPPVVVQVVIVPIVPTELVRAGSKTGTFSLSSSVVDIQNASPSTGDTSNVPPSGNNGASQAVDLATNIDGMPDDLQAERQPTVAALDQNIFFSSLPLTAAVHVDNTVWSTMPGTDATLQILEGGIQLRGDVSDEHTKDKKND